MLRQVGLELQDMLHCLLAPGKEGAGPPDRARHRGHSPADRWGSLQGKERESSLWQEPRSKNNCRCPWLEQISCLAAVKGSSHELPAY